MSEELKMPDALEALSFLKSCVPPGCDGFSTATEKYQSEQWDKHHDAVETIRKALEVSQ